MEEYEQDFEEIEDTPNGEVKEEIQSQKLHQSLTNLENFDPYNIKCRIKSPTSLQVCREEGVKLKELYVKGKDEIKVCLFIRTWSAIIILKTHST